MKILLLYWLLFTFAVIAIHLFIIKVKKRSPNKTFWYWFRFFVGVLFVLMELKLQTHYLYVSILMYGMSNWFFHDTLIALGLRERPWYLNDNGDLDKLQPKAGWVYIWIIKLIAAFTLMAMYLFNK
jgi:hypothetical protein